MRLEAAREEQKQAVCRFYEEVCCFQEMQPYGPAWHYGIYPAPEELERHVSDGNVYLLYKKGRIAAAMVLLNGEDPIYQDLPFTVKTEPLLMLHLFAVHPAFRGQGLAKEALHALLEFGQKAGARAIHLDVVADNLPAERLYQSMGFHYVQEREVFYEDTGNLLVKLYEYNFT